MISIWVPEARNDNFPDILLCYSSSVEGFWDLISPCCEVVARTSTLNFSEHTVNYRRELSDAIYLTFQSVNFLTQFISYSTSETELLCFNSELPRQFWSKKFYFHFLIRRILHIRNHNIIRWGRVVCLFVFPFSPSQILWSQSLIHPVLFPVLTTVFVSEMKHQRILIPGIISERQ